MKKQKLQDKYPVFSIEIAKKNCTGNNVEDILKVLKEKIEAHPVAQFIAFFDHFSHTQNLENGLISPEIIDAQIIVFCFGKKLENPLQLAVRPRSIGVTETNEKFILSFLDAPNPAFNEVMEKWIKDLIKIL
jgi:uncharacterized protein YifN (PemK superfamily)